MSTVRRYALPVGAAAATAGLVAAVTIFGQNVGSSQRLPRSGSTSRVLETLLFPTAEGRTDGRALLVRLENGRTQSFRLTDATEADLVSGQAGSLGLRLFSQEKGASFSVLGPDFTPGRAQLLDGHGLVVLSLTKSGYWVQRGASFVEVDAGGRTVSSRRVSTSATGKRGAFANGKPAKVIMTDGPGEVAATVTTASDIVFLTNARPAATLASTAGSATGVISGVTSVLDAEWSSSANAIYALGWDSTSSNGHLVFVTLDAGTFAERSRVSLPLLPNQTNLCGYNIVATASHGVFVHTSQLDGDTWTTRLTRVDEAVAADPIVLPPMSGISATVGPDDDDYLYNGPAGSVVSRYDFGSGQTTTGLPDLNGPDGSVVTSLVFPTS